MNNTFVTALNLVWRPGFDTPADGDHVTPGDPGKETKAGITAETWANAERVGIVKGTLQTATVDQLSTILRTLYWGQVCDDLPPGLDLMLFNGRMMTGRYPYLFQQALGFTGPEMCDGWIGPETLQVARSRHGETFIEALTGIHYNYLAGLETWPAFGRGWTNRLNAARIEALSLVSVAPVA